MIFATWIWAFILKDMILNIWWGWNKDGLMDWCQDFLRTSAPQFGNKLSFEDLNFPGPYQINALFLEARSATFACKQIYINGSMKMKFQQFVDHFDDGATVL